MIFEQKKQPRSQIQRCKIIGLSSTKLTMDGRTGVRHRRTQSRESWLESLGSDRVRQLWATDGAYGRQSFYVQLSPHLILSGLARLFRKLYQSHPKT